MKKYKWMSHKQVKFEQEFQKNRWWFKKMLKTTRNTALAWKIFTHLQDH